jgi:D-threo-aldose 1-dehydrogenase
MMEPTTKVRLGRTDLEIPRLGFGAAPLGGLLRETSERDAVEAVQSSLASGLSYFDTAPQYGGGMSERRLGSVLRQVDRKRIIVSTKVGKIVHLRSDAPTQSVGFVGAPAHDIEYDYSYDGVRRSLDASLERLSLDHVDIVFIHDVNRKYHGSRVYERLEEALAGACKALTDLREQGVIKAFGAATKDLDIASAFVERADVDCAMLPARLTLLDQTGADELLPRCVERSISVLAAAPFDSGILVSGVIEGVTYDYQPAREPVIAQVAAIEALCARFRIPIAAAALQFPLRHAAVASVVAGMRLGKEVRQNLDSMRMSIDEGFWVKLQQLKMDFPTNY